MKQESESNHVISYRYEGEGMMEMKTPICSCGWEGIGYEAYNDCQHTETREQAEKHLRDVESK